MAAAAIGDTDTPTKAAAQQAANHMMRLNWGLEDGAQTEEEKQIQRIVSLVQEFFGAPWANWSGDSGGDTSVLESWFTELGVGWVLLLPLSDGAGELEHTASDHARSWIQALLEIVETFRLTRSLFPDRGSMSIICEGGQSKGQAIVADDQQFLQSRRVMSKLFRRVTNKLFWTNSSGCEEEPDTGSSIICEEQQDVPDQLQFAQFFQETMLKMLAFVDLIAGEQVLDSSWGQEAYEKLGTLLGVHGALSTALPQIWLSSYSPPSEQVFKIQRDLVGLLAAKQEKMGEAIWSTMERTWTRMVESMEDSSETPAPPGSSDIHRVTRSVITYIGFLGANYSSVASILSGAAGSGKYEPQNVEIPPLDSMVMEMASCLEEKLAKISQVFPNHSLGFLFLINNLHHLTEHLRPMSCFNNFSIRVLTRKIRSYIEYYLQVSWAPALLCLHIRHTPLRLWRYRSPLPEFNSEFLKIYGIQKFWKVPDPNMRYILRKAVTEKVVSGLTEYLRDTDTVVTKGSIFSLMSWRRCYKSYSKDEEDKLPYSNS